MAFATDTKTLNISTTVSDLQSMRNAQSFACQFLIDRLYDGEYVPYLTKHLSGYSGTVLSNVFGTQSAETIAKNLVKVRTDNPTLAQSVGGRGIELGDERMKEVINSAVNYGASSVSLTVDYIRVYDTSQKVTVFTVVNKITVKSMTLPDGTVIQ